MENKARISEGQNLFITHSSLRANTYYSPERAKPTQLGDVIDSLANDLRPRSHQDVRVQGSKFLT